jgi:hypothetical protein
MEEIQRIGFSMRIMYYCRVVVIYRTIWIVVRVATIVAIIGFLLGIPIGGTVKP